jgi:hypothetical protein
MATSRGIEAATLKLRDSEEAEAGLKPHPNGGALHYVKL